MNQGGNTTINIRVDLAIQLKLNMYRIMNNLYDTLCTNSKVSVTLTSLLFESNYTCTVPSVYDSYQFII